MKRLNLEAFKLKNFKNKSNNEEEAMKFAQLLGQVLGNCHDEPTGGGQSPIVPPLPETDWDEQDVE